jgi:hypothetical protein
MRPELERKRLLVLAPRNGDGVKTHPSRELHAEMAQPAYAENGDEVAGTRTASAPTASTRPATSWPDTIGYLMPGKVPSTGKESL